MNFVKLYIGDYQRDTGHLSIAEHGAYLLMLQHHYATEKPLPTGKGLHRLLRAESKADREAIDSVVGQFWREEAGGLVNDRAADEIQKASHQRTVNQEIGKRGGRPKLTESVSETRTESETESVSESEPNRNPSHSQTPDKPPIPPKGGASPAVEFKTFVSDCKARGEKAIADYRPVFAYAESVGLPTEFVQLAWFEFARQFGEGGVKQAKRQKDWRLTFRNYVEKGYLKLWWLNGETFELTTAGKQAERANAERLAA